MAPIQIHPCLLFLVIVLSPALLSHAKTAPAVADAPSPVAEPLNFTHILEKGEQYKTFLRILKDTQVGAQVVNQLEDSIEGLTVMAPTDNAFNSLKTGTLNKLTNQQQSELVMYHILPKYYSFVTFQTTSNPVPTQATSEDGTCTVNITSGSNQANISTGVDETTITNALYQDFPLAVYSVDKVLLPPDLFGPKSAKSHSSASTKGNTKNNGTSALSPSSDSEDDTNADTKSASGADFKGAHWGSIAGVLFMSILNLL
ncbi:fasciclin-like arabinogalactan protein 6 [Carex littledalei]|uniref:Fasciclin-like arabinogalactan protein 6 n=1 Tax=Carex littledalei TaxID=544730 RepID=A0A833R335_9POAL|nr:fasciclin-like arabinogalactan protein 6 [Carex littledalei]